MWCASQHKYKYELTNPGITSCRNTIRSDVTGSTCATDHSTRGLDRRVPSPPLAKRACRDPSRRTQFLDVETFPKDGLCAATVSVREESAQPFAKKFEPHERATIKNSRLAMDAQSKRPTLLAKTELGKGSSTSSHSAPGRLFCAQPNGLSWLRLISPAPPV